MPKWAVFFNQNGFTFKIKCYSLEYAEFINERLKEESWIEEIVYV